MKFLRFTFFLLLLSVAATSIYAQDHYRSCGTMEYLQMQQLTDPKLEFRMESIEHFTRNRIAQPQGRAVTGVITIPVVVHVVYNTAAENISDAQIMSQIAILNEDFRRLNSDANNLWSQADDAEIEFCLASRDPSGNATTGITRTSTTRTSFSSNNNVKFDANGGKNAWPAADYLNIWVCDLNGLLGYAQFPGGSASTDGVVCDYAAFGNTGVAAPPFDLGRTATHEVGHWLNLRHIWGDGGCSVDDFVTDTPTSDAANYGCATGHISCGTEDMVQNYMDYSDDACMNLFTTGQKDRMRILFETGGARASLLNSVACQPPAPPSCNDGIQNGGETGVDCGGPNCAPCASCSDGIQNGSETGVDCGGPNCAPCPCLDNTVNLSITLDNYPEETSWTLRTSGGALVASGGTYGNQPDGSTVTASFCLPDGCYDFQITDTYGDGICCSYGNGSYTLTYNGTVLASGGSFGSSATTAFCVGGGSGPTCSDGIQNGGETGVDCGGPNCAPCTNCNDGIQNGGETGIDCGGPDCAPCATCNDGIQNGDETGIDCGGSCPNSCGGGSSDVLLGSYFEGGWDGWTDGGADAARVSSSFSYEGSYSIRLQDNSGTASSMSSPNINVSSYDQVELEFHFYPNSMENGEDFWVRYYNGSNWTTIATYAAGSSFQNGSFYVATITLNNGAYNFPTNARFRIQCDASADNDQIFVDAVTVTGISGGRVDGQSPEPTIRAVDAKAPPALRPQLDRLTPELPNIVLYPNPARDRLFLNLPAQLQVNGLKVYDANGRLVRNIEGTERVDQLNIGDLQRGFYYLSVETPDGVINKKFVKQ